MIRKILLRAGLVLAVVTMGLFIWMLWPGEGVELRQLVPADSFAVVSFKLERSNKRLRELIKSLHLGPGRRFLLPTEVAVAVVANPEISYVILFESSRAAKLIRLFRPWAGKWIGKPYAIFGSAVIVSDDGELIKQVKIGSGKERGKQIRGGRIFIDNRRSGLTQVVRKFEKKNLFQVFPAVASVEWIKGNFNIGNEGEIKGILTFKLGKGVYAGEVESDIQFLGQIIKRFCKAKKLNFSEELRIGNGYIDLNFEIQGLNRLFYKGTRKARE